MIGYYNIYIDGNEAINFRCNDKNQLIKYREILRDICCKIKKEFNSEPTYKNSNNITYIRAKIRDTCFHNNKLTKVNTQYKCLLQIKLESIYRSRESLYYPQVFLEECKNEVKNIKRTRHIMALKKAHLMNQIMNLRVMLMIMCLIVIMNVIIMNLKSLLMNLKIMNLKSLLMNLKIINLKTLLKI